jgi:hypothetical protein
VPCLVARLSAGAALGDVEARVPVVDANSRLLISDRVRRASDSRNPGSSVITRTGLPPASLGQPEDAPPEKL